MQRGFAVALGHVEHLQKRGGTGSKLTKPDRPPPGGESADWGRAQERGVLSITPAAFFKPCFPSDPGATKLSLELPGRKNIHVLCGVRGSLSHRAHKKAGHHSSVLLLVFPLQA